MKKLILLFLVIVLKFSPAKAQWVTIPDASFSGYLNLHFPNCMIGNQLNTSCPEIQTASSFMMNNQNISDLTGLEYFGNLIRLSCASNSITSIPSLPSTLRYLNCDLNQLTNLPSLPSNLDTLLCQNNQITEMPVLPSSLKYLGMQGNLVSVCPVLPDSLLVFSISSCPITSLSTLPPNLTNLSCGWTQITSLPHLPNSLKYLYSYNTPISNLPNMPDSLLHLVMPYNQLTNLQALPSSIEYLDVRNNMLTQISRCPNTMERFWISNNNISCLLNLPNVPSAIFGTISSNPLSCIPNQTSYSLGLPFCMDNDVINNPNNCPGNVNVSGRVYSDLSNNCIFDTADLAVNNVQIQLINDMNEVISQNYSANGTFGFSVTELGTYQVKLENTGTPLEMSCGQQLIQTITLTATDQNITEINFPVVCGSYYDANVQSVSRSGWVFPGQIHTLQTNVTNYSTWYNLQCDTNTYSGTVSIQVNGPISFFAPAVGALTPTVSGNTFTYNIPDFNTLNPNSFGLRFMTDTTAQAGDQVCVHVEISPNPIDADTTNNIYDFCYNVVNSYDPNMKEVYPVNVLPGYDDWFTYTIHFQNTGNAPAFNIRLRDTLDTQLDLNTFEVLGYSHPANVTVSGNILNVRFNNIMLPDSTTDYEGSMGYFQYRIKPLPNLPNGSQINNTAYIYFDFNAPIVTNTTENNFEFPVKVSSIVSSENSFSLFPNPSTGVFTFKDTKNLNTVEVYSILGEKILTQTNQKTINLNGFSKGIYFARVNGMQVVKLVKE